MRPPWTSLQCKSPNCDPFDLCSRAGHDWTCKLDALGAFIGQVTMEDHGDGPTCAHASLVFGPWVCAHEGCFGDDINAAQKLVELLFETLVKTNHRSKTGREKLDRLFAMEASPAKLGLRLIKGGRDG